MADLRIGISGWSYGPWRRGFYPRGLAPKDELRFASRAFGSIEINASFYALQTPERYALWHAQAPDGFVFSVKAPRFVTHVRRLRDVRKPLANFFASGLFRLREKLGPILWQLPPGFRFDPAQLETFLALLPHDNEAALALAREHDPRLDEQSHLQIDRRRPLRHALEVRHESFLVPALVELLRAHDVALVVADSAGKWPWCEDLCSDFVYLRLHGDTELYASGYGDEALDFWSRRIRAWSRGGQPQDARLILPQQPPPALPERDVYCYFDNTAKTHAPFDAARLLRLLGLERGLLPAAGARPCNPPGVAA